MIGISASLAAYLCCFLNACANAHCVNACVCFEANTCKYSSSSSTGRLRSTQLLRPRAKKLTLIDARRVMSIYEETTRRVQLVSGLLEQTTISSVVKRLNTSLGLELVDALSQYSSVLDLFDEVTIV